jgi:NADH-quinone oxidoreductase subunit J
MSVQQVFFIIFGVIALGSAIRVVTSRRIFHAALWQILAFFGVAAIYTLLESPLMAMLQLFIYIGGVSVLIVVAIMVTKGMMRIGQRMTTDPWTSLMLSLALFGTMAWMILQIPLPKAPLYPVPDDGIALVGQALVDPAGYLVPFEVISIVLLMVLISALYLGRER